MGPYASSEPTPRNTKILCVDDDADIREIALLSLTLDSGFDVETCASGKDALSRAAEWQPDLILLDVMMPDMDGPETLRRLSSAPETAKIPVIFMTARTKFADTSHDLELKAASVIAKPFDPISLASNVRRHLDAFVRERN